ncbi:MAG: hypothetical protein R3C12_04370 [Planctomycetaceae bacterium]
MLIPKRLDRRPEYQISTRFGVPAGPGGSMRGSAFGLRCRVSQPYVLLQSSTAREMVISPYVFPFLVSSHFGRIKPLERNISSISRGSRSHQNARWLQSAWSALEASPP